MKSCGIYAIVCLPTGVRYVGQAKRIERRLWSHRGKLRRGVHRNNHLQSAWDKYGVDQFSFKPVLLCSVKQLTFYEQLIADGYRAAGLFNKGKFVDNATRDNPEHRVHISKVSNKLWRDSNHRTFMSINAVANHADPNYRARYEAGLERGWQNITRRESAAITMQKQWDDPTFRVVSSSASAARWRDPAMRALMSDKRRSWEWVVSGKVFPSISAVRDAFDVSVRRTQQWRDSGVLVKRPRTQGINRRRLVASEHHVVVLGDRSGKLARRSGAPSSKEGA